MYRRKEVSSHWSVNFDSGGTFTAFVLFRRNPSWSPQDRTSPGFAEGEREPTPLNGGNRLAYRRVCPIATSDRQADAGGH